jgi:hypothetical protein
MLTGAGWGRPRPAACILGGAGQPGKLDAEIKRMGPEDLDRLLRDPDEGEE